MLKRLLFIGSLLLLAAGLAFDLTLPDVRSLATQFPKTTAFMELRKAALARAGENTRLEWTPVPLSRISPDLRRAIIAAEDARFYEHGGVDWDATRASLEKDIAKRRLKAGGSTITQQLAKNLFLSPSRTPWRKLREWAIARRLESSLSKRRILEIYLNVIEFGWRTYGVEAAAHRYFQKSAAELTPLEGATLAAVIPSPRLYDPIRRPALVGRRARRILRAMRRNDGPGDASSPAAASKTGLAATAESGEIGASAANETKPPAEQKRN